MNNTQQQTKLKVATVKLSAIEFEGLRNPETGEYRVAAPQVVKLFSYTDIKPASTSNPTKTLKFALGEDFQPVPMATELNPNPANTIDLQQFRKVIRHFDCKGNNVAQNMMDILMDVSLENLFNDAFGIKNTSENNQKIANESLQRKYEEIVNNDSLNHTQKQRRVNMMFAQYELEKAQAEEEKEQLLQSDENKKKFINELKSIIETEWDWGENENVTNEDVKQVLKRTLEFYKVFKDLKDNVNRDYFYNTNVFISKFANKSFIRGQHTTIGKFAKRICEDFNISYNEKGTRNNEDSEIGLSQAEYPFELLEYLTNQITPKGNKYASIKNSLRVVIKELENLYGEDKLPDVDIEISDLI